MLTVELRPRISSNVCNADKVSLMNAFSIFSISESSLGTCISFSLFSSTIILDLEPHPCSSLVDELGQEAPSFLVKRMLSIISHSLTRTLSTSVSKKGWFSTSWIKGKRSSAPVRLSCFFIIFTRPA